jgi:signal peptidase I
MIKSITRRARANAGFLLFLLGMFVFRSAVADWNYIPSGSMEPTLQVGDRVLVDQHAYAWRLPFTRVHLAERGAPRAGDVITFASPVDGERLIKRVVAVGGDTVLARRGVLYVNRHPVGTAGYIEFGPVEVPAGHVFVMGDNHDDSFDSRFWGPLAVDRIYGRALKVVASFDGLLPRGDRFWVGLGASR